MSFWNGEKLAERLPDLMDRYDPAQIDCNAYTLRIGNEAYVSSGRGKKKGEVTVRQLGAGEGFTIPPGQFAYLITDEVVEIPKDAMAFISIKAKIKFRGLVNISGFHVDPGYKGRLIFSVFNAGPAVLHLRQGQNCFLIWFADLVAPCSRAKTGVFNETIDPELINSFPGESLSLEALDARIALLESKQAGLDTRTAATFVLASGLWVGAILMLVKTFFNV